MKIATNVRKAQVVLIQTCSVAYSQLRTKRKKSALTAQTTMIQAMTPKMRRRSLIWKSN